MEDFAGKIELYHNLFFACLAVCIVCAVIAVVIFIILDIKSVVGFLTGRRAKKQIQKLEENNASSGRLFRKSRGNMQYVDRQMKEDMGVRGTATPGARKVEHVVSTGQRQEFSDSENQTFAQQDSQGAENTSVLETDEADKGTALLYKKDDAEEKQGDSQSGRKNDFSTEILSGKGNAKGAFRIEKEIILIHSEEVI